MRESAAAPLGERLRAIVEALVFAAEEPLTLDDLIDLFPAAGREILQTALDGVRSACEPEERGLTVQRVAGGYRMATKPELGEWVRALFRSRNRRRLTSQALETLAIIAYRQPITTPEIQAIRGADPTSVLEALLDKKLVRVLGRKKVVGKPLLYGTTREFLAHFGLNSLEDLPDIAEFGMRDPGAGSRPSGSVTPPAAAMGAVGPFEEDDDGSGGNGEETQEDEDDENERGEDGDDS
ncbi:MAG: SMC-Scp complex subunit ScpB [Acidobacteria bacterium 13_1_20CM_2_68_7]|nr:MAG: SMC-Scp complex subunit ScpB [Acidobacteria bacterium 13_1_20CM_2_68_7]